MNSEAIIYTAGYFRNTKGLKNIVVIKVCILAVQISKVPNFSFSFGNTLGIRSSIRTRKTSKQTNVFI